MNDQNRIVLIVLLLSAIIFALAFRKAITTETAVPTCAPGVVVSFDAPCSSQVKP